MSAEPSLEQVCERLSVKPSSVAALYLMGSRLWGTARHDSDYDFCMVCKGSQSKRNVHAGNYDCTVYGEKEFRECFAQGKFQVVLTRWLPASNVVVERLGKPLGKVDSKALRKAVLEESERDWRIAEKKMRKGDVEGSKKVVAHLLRMLSVACKFVREPSATPVLVDEAELELVTRIRAMYSRQWSDWEAAFEDTRRQFIDTLR